MPVPGPPQLPERPVPYTLTTQADARSHVQMRASGPGAVARRAGGDGMTATSASVRFGEDGTATVQSYVRLTTASTHIQCCTYEDAAPILAIRDGAVDITITNPGGARLPRRTWGRAACWPRP